MASACAEATASAVMTEIAAAKRATIQPPPLPLPVWGEAASVMPLWFNLTGSLGQVEHDLRVLVTDFFLVGLRQIKRLHDRHGRADVAPALFLIERTIGGEQDMIGAEERNAANRGGARAGERRVAVEAFEIVERPFLELLQDQRIILIR